MAGLIVDSSIVLSWCSPDETSGEADAIQTTVAEHGALAPGHWPLEVANALLMAVRRRRIDARFCAAALRDLATLPIALDSETSARAWHDTLRLAEAHHLTVYDAAYLELAQRRKLPLATLDRALSAAAGALGVAVRAGPPRAT
ncbi:MAG TPA: type II toxin-antitoxin system VapC family toxin [Geminicoccaceae bacterium]|nr:type II toxin-antitoxin system VapC family toxin [Geminicoccaceae bacterium]